MLWEIPRARAVVIQRELPSGCQADIRVQSLGEDLKREKLWERQKEDTKSTQAMGRKRGDGFQSLEMEWISTALSPVSSRSHLYLCAPSKWERGSLQAQCWGENGLGIFLHVFSYSFVFSITWVGLSTFHHGSCWEAENRSLIWQGSAGTNHRVWPETDYLFFLMPGQGSVFTFHRLPEVAWELLLF